MAKEKTSTALAVSTPVPDVLVAIEEKLKGLKRIEETVFKCPKDLEGFGNIQAEMKIENLIKAYGSVKARSAVYADAAADLGLGSIPVFQIGGCNVDEWKHDIDLRIQIITHKETYDKLNSYKERMSKFLSEEDQKAMLLKEMAEFVNGK